MSHHYFVNKFLQEISIIIILISYLNFHGSKSTRFAIIYYNLLSKKCVTDLIKSINTSFTNLIKRDLTRVRNIC